MEVFIILILLWIYVLYCLINGRKIIKELEVDTNAVMIILFLALVAISYIRAQSLWITALMVIAILVYNVIPSGYSNDAFYIRGIKYSFKKIKEIQYITYKNKKRIVFVYKNRLHYMICDSNSKEILQEIEKLSKKEIGYYD